ncbi:unnamed protein product [Lota lota]
MRRAGRGYGVSPIRDIRQLNRRADIEHKRRLDLLEAQYRYTLKKLQQRKDSLLRDQERDTLLKACQPKATVHRNMREIARLESSDGGADEGRRDAGVRLCSSRSLPAAAGARPTESPPPQRARASTASWLSIRQLKDIAAIDSIAAREKARREQRAREELQRLRDGEMATLRQRIKAFNDTIGNVGGMGLPASTGKNPTH